MTNKLDQWLETKTIARNLILLDNVDSTNSYAKNLLNGGIADGTVIIAKTQTSGRGQQANSWCSPDGGLYYSCIIENPQGEYLTLMTLACGIACQEAILDLTGLSVRLKWVNDIIIDSKKLGGILLETRSRGNKTWLIAGIGINVNLDPESLSPEVSKLSTSLKYLTGKEFDLYHLAAILSNKLEKYLCIFNDRNYKLIKSLWLKNSITFARKIRFNYQNQKIEGIVIDINEMGELIIQDYSGNQHTINSNREIEYLD
jgi:BirA family biotin operon repressor/biotin-[acetyl-CoA-carboxylase] ligase